MKKCMISWVLAACGNTHCISFGLRACVHIRFEHKPCGESCCWVASGQLDWH